MVKLTRLRCYNQYPGLYEDFSAMREDLRRIRKMGFAQVWVNPFYTPCQVNLIPNMQGRINSPYAMKDETIHVRYAKDDSFVKEYTQEAFQLGLTPIFDLVPRHVAVDHRFLTGDPQLRNNHNIDTTKWFKRHPNGNLVMNNVDENYLPTTKNPWADVAAFDYDNMKFRKEIIKYFWDPFIKYNIQTLGFRGIRIDAPTSVPPDVLGELVAIANQSYREEFTGNLIIIAETIGRNYQVDNQTLKGKATHALNSVYWMPGPEGAYGHEYSLWSRDDNWFYQNKGLLQQIGPTVGFSGSHDEPRYRQQLEERGITDRNLLMNRMREKFAVTAFTSDGGWIFLYGDEYAARQPINLFDPVPVLYHKDTRLQIDDLSSFVKNINQIIKKLPNPSFPEWTQRIFLANHCDLVIFIVHQGVGFSANNFVIIANTNPQQKVVIQHDDIRTIMEANGRNDSAERTHLPKQLFLCGELEVDCALRNCLGDANIFQTEKKSKDDLGFFSTCQGKKLTLVDGHSKLSY